MEAEVESDREESDVQCIEASELCDFKVRPNTEILLSKAPEGETVFKRSYSDIR